MKNKISGGAVSSPESSSLNKPERSHHESKNKHKNSSARGDKNSSPEDSMNKKHKRNHSKYTTRNRKLSEPTESHSSITETPIKRPRNPEVKEELAIFDSEEDSLMRQMLLSSRRSNSKSPAKSVKTPTVDYLPEVLDPTESPGDKTTHVDSKQQPDTTELANSEISHDKTTSPNLTISCSSTKNPGVSQSVTSPLHKVTLARRVMFEEEAQTVDAEPLVSSKQPSQLSDTAGILMPEESPTADDFNNSLLSDTNQESRSVSLLKASFCFPVLARYP